MVGAVGNRRRTGSYHIFLVFAHPENKLYLTFLVCSAPSRTKLPEQMRTVDSRSTPIKLTTWHTSVVARLVSSFVDCDKGLV